MRISGIDFPEEVLAALRDDRLVLFAGAGVSMGHPANLPDFRELACRVAQGTGHCPSDGEPIDQFLGGLATSGVDVHALTAKTLSGESLSATPLHHQLLRCFRNEEAIRVVTTNFDQLFELAAKSECLEFPEVFRAPALPLGAEFEGIVHLHGSVIRPSQMTLTDADFGRAYLIDRWSPRFLVDVFRTFTVLFVGYSHDDTVMNYLGRALAEANRLQANSPSRFVLTVGRDKHERASEDERWAALGISPILYERDSDGEHTGLIHGIAGLADYMHRGLLDWQRTINDLARGLPPHEPEAQHLIDDSLGDPARVRFFTEAADDPAWIEWLDERGHLAKLFDSAESGRMADTRGQLAWWLVKRFAWDQPNDLLSLFGRHGMRLGHELWTLLASELVARDEETGEERIWQSEVLGKWISLLLDNVPKVALNLDAFLRNIAQAAHDAELDDMVVMVFDVMAGQSIGDRQAFGARDWALDDVWENLLTPRIDLVAGRLVEVALAQLRQRHQRAQIWSRATRGYDAAHWHRDRIESRNDDSRYFDANDVLVDAARECLVHLVENEPVIVSGHLDRIIREDAPLLRRIAVHCAMDRDDLSVDQKIDWLLSRISLHDRACQRELFRFMGAVYRDAPDAQRRRVLDAVDNYPLPTQESGPFDD